MRDQRAQTPRRNTGISLPSARMPVISRSAVPIMKSTCVSESFKPASFSYSLLISMPPSTFSG